MWTFSLMVYVDSQEEADSWYETVSAAPEAEICGWAKDQFGISWQIVPRILMEEYDSASPEQIKAVNAAVMTMKRLESRYRIYSSLIRLIRCNRD